ncbi:SIMPL domain-containing protein [Actinoplanes sp. CA-015351]|uniref:SIMPL domain-containing protein n=1 Tax=Actinoplanes sp. CA-015351 TaxID=3239897 RepID=UPI003D95496F
MKRTLVVLAALLALIPAGGGAAYAATTEDRESVLVTGAGEVSGVPDLLTANFAVETTATTVKDALDRASAAATRMRDTLVRAGITKADLQTADVSIGSRRDEHEKIIGYSVNQGLTAKIRNMAKAGALMSDAIKAGGDAARLNGVSFAIEDDEALLTEARKKAFANARAKAELYAKEAGRPLGRVVKVSEDAPSLWASGGHKNLAAYDSALAIEPGRQGLTVTVTVEWALGTA